MFAATEITWPMALVMVAMIAGNLLAFWLITRKDR